MALRASGAVESDATVEEDLAVESTSRPRWQVTALEFNAVALMASTVITALVGLGFWAIAARLPAAEVGRTSAILSSATMLSQLASSNVGVLFGRVLAGAGPKARKVVLTGYGVASALGALLGLGFLLFYSGDTLFVSVWERAVFPVLVVLFGVFAMQDWVLIGMRRSAWVPVEQLVFSLAKLGLLVWFSAMALSGGIVWAWAIPCLLTVVVINPILLFRVLPRLPPAGPEVAPLPGRRALARIFLAEYATGTLTVVTPLTLPLLVVGLLGREANAYYALPWLIAESLGLLMWNVSSSYMVEASHDGREQAALMRRTLRLSLLICLLGVPFLLLTAPWLLSFLGNNYAEQGASVLRLMVLAIPFTIIDNLYINTCRVKNRMGRVVALQVVNATTVIGLAVILLPRLGVDGAGWAFLTTQVLAAALTIVPVVRSMRGDEPAPAPVSVTAPGPIPPVTPIPPADAAGVPPHDETRPMTVVTRGPRT